MAARVQMRFHSNGGRIPDTCKANPIRVSSQSVCPVQKREDVGKGHEELGMDTIGDPNRGERLELLR